MNSSNNRQKQMLGRTLQAGLLLLGMLAFGQSAMAAGTAANTTLTNTVEVAYKNLSGTVDTTATASATITIELVKAAPTLASNSASTFDDISEGETVTVSYQVTTNANGPDLYNIDFTETLSTDFSATEVAFDPIPASTVVGYLGASTVGAVLTLAKATTNDCLATAAGTAGESAGTCDLNVPNDVSGAWAGVNGIEGGDIIVLDGTLYCDVVSVSANQGVAYDPNTPAAASTIEINNCGTDLVDRTELVAATYALAIGDDIAETKAISVSFVVGDLSNGATTGTTTIAAVATDDDDTVTSGTVNTTINVLGVVLEIYKYVRNIDDTGQTGTVAAPYDRLSIDGTFYYRTGITAAPGETLEYAVLLLNKAGAVKDLVATDPIVPFTTYNSTFRVELYPEETITEESCATGNTCVVTFGTSSTSTDDGLTTDTDFAGLNGTTITVYPGTGGNENGAVGGTIAVDKVSYFLYQLTVQN